MEPFKSVWKFFSSVRLALFTLCAIALTSIIGTIIPQKNSLSFYSDRYGEEFSRLLYIFDIPDMYSSFWFTSLLALLCLNLIVCSIDRFPFALRIITTDNSQLAPEKLMKMRYNVNLSGYVQQPIAPLVEHLKNCGWKIQSSSSGRTLVAAGQKGRWSRLGVYLVHLSILVIFLGGIIGSQFGYKGSVMIPETKQTAKVFSADDQQPQPLGFEIRCDKFEIEFYENGMVKEYRSRLTVFENGQTVLVKDIEVNDPLKYKGVTFYQASYEGYRDFVIRINNPVSGNEKVFIAPYQRKITWEEENLHFGIVTAEVIGKRITRAKLWLQAGDNPPAEIWVESTGMVEIVQGDTIYSASVKQMYGTGLQVAKDPGVWTVYAGCLLMLVGLYLTFFMSHRRIWIYYCKTSGSETISLAGTTNKNKLAFEKSFSDIAEQLTQITQR